MAKQNSIIEKVCSNNTRLFGTLILIGLVFAQCTNKTSSNAINSPPSPESEICTTPLHEYFIDTAGDDTADGISSITPWKSLSKVNNFAIEPCTTIYFKSGGIWRGQLLPVSGSETIGPVKYSSYGSGDLPIILGSVDASGVGAWSNVAGFSTSLWRSTRTSLDANNGNTPIDVGNLYFIDNSGNISVGFKKFATEYSNASLTSILTSQGDFILDKTSGYVWIKSATNPGSFYQTIEAALSKDVIYLHTLHDVIIEKLAIKFGGKGGINAIDSSRLIFQDLQISYVGGAEWEGHPNQRLGDGFQIWRNGSHILFQRNKVWETYDGGVTNQADSSAQAVIDDVIYQNNIIWNTPFASAIIFNYGSGNSTMSNVKFINNTSVNPHVGWSMAQRPDIKSQHLYLADLTNAPQNVEISNNIFYGGYIGNFIVSMGPNKWNSSTMSMNSNCYFGMSGNSDLDISISSRWKNEGSNIWSMSFAGGAPTVTLNGSTGCTIVANKASLVSDGQCFYDGNPTSSGKGNFYLYSTQTPGSNLGYQTITTSIPRKAVVIVDTATTYDLSQFSTYQALSNLDVFANLQEPLFVNAGLFNFHLQNASACRTGGQFLGVTSDFDRVARPATGTQGTSIGAFEYH